MKSASSQLTKIADLGCNMFLGISFLPSSLYKLYSTRFAQVYSFQSTSPQAKIAFWRGKSFFIFMKHSFPSMVWISHEFSFQDGQLYVSCKMEPSKYFPTVLLSVESFAESGSVSLLWFLLLWQFIFQVCQCWKTVKKHLLFCGDVIFFFEDKTKSQEVNEMGKTKLFQLSPEEDSHLIHTQNNF